ncbi:uncharacterized protein LOC125500885 [Athalia rosae]|uniref:uncharacterized protein LOC125500885 n=1 Tax=Athalia rosae TaxID=37344 RepID=UPI0020335197|nr:uncharacterized protein LOC125500885 [Athalia rosae]
MIPSVMNDLVCLHFQAPSRIMDFSESHSDNLINRFFKACCDRRYPATIMLVRLTSTDDTVVRIAFENERAVQHAEERFIDWYESQEVDETSKFKSIDIYMNYSPCCGNSEGKQGCASRLKDWLEDKEFKVAIYYAWFYINFYENSNKLAYVNALNELVNERQVPVLKITNEIFQSLCTECSVDVDVNCSYDEKLQYGNEGLERQIHSVPNLEAE